MHYSHKSGVLITDIHVPNWLQDRDCGKRLNEEYGMPGPFIECFALLTLFWAKSSTYGGGSSGGQFDLHLPIFP